MAIEFRRPWCLKELVNGFYLDIVNSKQYVINAPRERGIFMLQAGVKCGRITVSVEEWADVGGCAWKARENRHLTHKLRNGGSHEAGIHRG